jgi:hypothetical protein
MNHPGQSFGEPGRKPTSNIEHPPSSDGPSTVHWRSEVGDWMADVLRIRRSSSIRERHVAGHSRPDSRFVLHPCWKAHISDFRFRALLTALVVALADHPQALHACAACAGRSDSAMAQGMNWGIFSLLAVIVAVLGSIAGFFIFLARRSAAAAAVPAQSPFRESANVTGPRQRIVRLHGRTDDRKRWMAGTVQRIARLAHRCAREQADFGTTRFGACVRGFGRESNRPTL